MGRTTPSVSFHQYIQRCQATKLAHEQQQAESTQASRYSAGAYTAAGSKHAGVKATMGLFMHRGANTVSAVKRT